MNKAYGPAVFGNNNNNDNDKNNNNNNNNKLLLHGAIPGSSSKSLTTAIHCPLKIYSIHFFIYSTTCKNP